MVFPSRFGSRGFQPDVGLLEDGLYFNIDWLADMKLEENGLERRAFHVEILHLVCVRGEFVRFVSHPSHLGAELLW